MWLGNYYEISDWIIIISGCYYVYYKMFYYQILFYVVIEAIDELLYCVLHLFLYNVN